MFLFSCKHTQKLFFELTEICVYVTNPLICKLFFPSKTSVYSCVSFNIFCIHASAPLFCDFQGLKSTDLYSMVNKSQTNTGRHRQYFVFFFYLRKAMEILIIFYLCLSSLRNFILSVIFFSIPMK